MDKVVTLGLKLRGLFFSTTFYIRTFFPGLTVKDLNQIRAFRATFATRFRIVDFADGAADPIDFPIAPKVANDRLLKQTGMNAQQVSS